MNTEQLFIVFKHYTFLLGLGWLSTNALCNWEGSSANAWTQSCHPREKQTNKETYKVC